MSDRPDLHEERIGELLAELPPAPEAWVQAAKDLPLALREIEHLAALAEADGAYREAVLADLATALRDAGVTPTDRAVGALHARLRDGADRP